MKISGLAKNGGVAPDVLILVEEGPFESKNLKGACG